MILLIDNYDSFTYNLLQYMGEVTGKNREIRVIRNDRIGIEGIKELAPEHIVISPGPCTPNEAGISIEVIREFAGKIPILGVCLGHQAIGQAFGGKIVLAKDVVHGKISKIHHKEEGIFSGIKQDFIATRYHSLVIEQANLPECLEVTATSPDDEIMAVVHKDYPNVIGLQFHPESILTSVGKQLLSNFLEN